jgi:hypothetical protein
MIAARLGNVEPIKALLEGGADVNARPEESDPFRHGLLAYCFKPNSRRIFSCRTPSPRASEARQNPAPARVRQERKGRRKRRQRWGSLLIRPRCGGHDLRDFFKS